MSHPHSAHPPLVSLYRPAGAAAPDAEARRWLDEALRGAPPPPVLAVIGLECGHLLEVLAERAPEIRVLALEPDPAAAASFRASPVAAPWLSSGRLVYLVDPEYAGSERAWRILEGVSAPAVLTHPRLAVETEASVRAARTLKNIVFGARANAAARRRFAPRYLVNALRNIPSMLRGRDVQALSGVFRGVPAVITAAGPSLDRALAELRAMSDRALVVATDTSLRPLLHAGIAPPLVVALDPGEANARHFQSLPDCTSTWLVSECALDGRATTVFDERVFWFRAGEHQPWPLLAELGIQAARLDVWGSVLTGAFQVASLAGCDPIVFVGADLAYTGGRPYTRGTTYEFDWAWHTSRGTSLEGVWREQIARRELQTETDLHGQPTVTTTSLLSFRDWLLSRAREGSARIVNATGAGMLYGDGIEQLSLSEALLNAPANLRPLSTLPRRAAACRPSAIATRLRRLGAAVRNGERSAPLDGWVAFSGEGFDPKGVADALDDAAHALETKRARQRLPALVPFSGDGMGALMPTILSTLPESLERFRQQLHTEGPCSCPARAVVHDADTHLLLAFDVLSAVARHTTRSDDVCPIVPVAAPIDSPVSALFHWPDHVRWAMQLFEAVLSATGPSLRGIVGRAAPAGGGHHDVGVTPDPRPNTSFALLQLALQWLLAVDAAADAPLPGLHDVMRVAPHAPTRATGPEADRLHIAGRAGTVSVPLGSNVRGRLAGERRASAEAPLLIASFVLNGTPIEVSVGGARGSARAVPASRYRAVS